MRHDKGSTIVEFVLVTALILVPLLLGTIVVGLNTTRAIQVVQLNRDAAHMFARGVNFSESTNVDMLDTLSGALNIKRPDGNGVMFLSEILKVGSTQCKSGCANQGYAVFTRRIAIGNQTGRASAFGSPGSRDSSGHVLNYLDDSTARTARFDPAVMAMADGEVAYVAETYYGSPDFDLAGFLTNTGVYARAIF